MNKCPDCMHEWDGKMCARCGYHPDAAMVNPKALPPGTVLIDRYVLGNSLGISRQSIAYAAWDQQMGQRVIITEFYPSVIVKRIQGEVLPQRNQAQFQVAMNRYHGFDGPQTLPLDQAFYGNRTSYRVYIPAEQPHLKEQAEVLLDQPILFRDEAGQAQMTINALMIDPLPKERPFTRAGNPGQKKKKKIIAGVLVLLLVLVFSSMIVLPMLQPQNTADPVMATVTSTPAAAATATATAEAEATPTADVTATATAEAEATPTAGVTATATAEAEATPTAGVTATATSELMATPLATATSEPAATPIATATTEPTAVPTATTVPEAKAEPWYLKVNGQLWKVDENGNAAAAESLPEGVTLDSVKLSGLGWLVDVGHLNKFILRSEKTGSEFELSNCEKDVTLELPGGFYSLIVGREMELIANRSIAKEEEFKFSTSENSVNLETAGIDTRLDEWDALFVEAQAFANANGKSVERLDQDGAGFYKVNDVYYILGKNGKLTELKDEDKESFHLVDQEDSLAELKIPLYPVQVSDQQLDRELFVQAMLSNMNQENTDEGLNIISLLIGEHTDTTFYASQGDYSLVISADNSFVTAAGEPYAVSTQFSVEDNGGQLELNGDDIKRKMIKEFDLWAYQVGQNAPVVCGNIPDSEKLTAIFGDLVGQDAALALRDVAFVNVNIGGKSLAFCDAAVVRNGKAIPLKELLIPAAEPAPMEQAEAETEDAQTAQQPSAKNADPVVVECASIQGLRLTDGAYTFYPSAGEEIKIDLPVSGTVEITLSSAEQQAVKEALLQKLADAGVGYIANVDAEQEGRFIYQLDAAQLQLAAAEVSTLDAQTAVEQLKYKVTIDCEPRELTAGEKDSLGIVYIGNENATAHEELSFDVNAEMDMLEKVALKDLAKWDGEKMILLLGPGSYCLCYTSEDDQTVKFSTPFAAGEEITLVMKDRCEHQWRTVVRQAATCSAVGYQQEVCSLCDEKGETTLIPRKEHTWKGPTCAEYATCEVCGEQDKTKGKLEHQVVAIKAVPACSKLTGSTEGAKCSVCNEILKQPAVIEKLATCAATNVEVEVVPATCTQNGQLWKECTRCKTRVQTPIPATGHSVINGTCVICGETDPSKPNNDSQFQGGNGNSGFDESGDTSTENPGNDLIVDPEETKWPGTGVSDRRRQSSSVLPQAA